MEQTEQLQGYIVTALTAEQVLMLEEVFARRVESGWEIPEEHRAWLDRLRRMRGLA